MIETAAPPPPPPPAPVLAPQPPAAPEPTAATHQAEWAVFTQIDADGSGTLDPEELYNFLAGMDEEIAKELTAALDTDGKLVLCPRDTRPCVFHLGLLIAAKTAGDGEVDFGEFVAGWNKVFVVAARSQPPPLAALAAGRNMQLAVPDVEGPQDEEWVRWVAAAAGSAARTEEEAALAARAGGMAAALLTDASRPLPSPLAPGPADLAVLPPITPRGEAIGPAAAASPRSPSVASPLRKKVRIDHSQPVAVPPAGGAVVAVLALARQDKQPFPSMPSVPTVGITRACLRDQPDAGWLRDGAAGWCRRRAVGAAISLLLGTGLGDEAACRSQRGGKGGCPQEGRGAGPPGGWHSPLHPAHRRRRRWRGRRFRGLRGRLFRAGRGERRVARCRPADAASAAGGRAGWAGLAAGGAAAPMPRVSPHRPLCPRRHCHLPPPARCRASSGGALAHERGCVGPAAVVWVAVGRAAGSDESSDGWRWSAGSGGMQWRRTGCGRRPTRQRAGTRCSGRPGRRRSGCCRGGGRWRSRRWSSPGGRRAFPVGRSGTLTPPLWSGWCSSTAWCCPPRKTGTSGYSRSQPRRLRWPSARPSRPVTGQL